MSSTPARIFTLGPAGTFSDQAAQRLRAHLGAGAGPVEYTRTIPEVLARTVGDPAALGVIPIENSDNGTVGQAQDSLVKHAVTIVWEITVAVRFSLVARGPLERVATCFAHPQAADQCSEYLAARLPGAPVLFTNSNMESGVKFLAEEPPVAAIVPVEFGAAHPELLVDADIQNYRENTTRFLVVRPGRGEGPPHLTGAKTSLLIEPDEDRPGLLFELLEIFNRYRVNLCRLESRPDKIKPWNYLFFIDFNNNDQSAACVADLNRTRNRITVLGSYDLLP